MNTDVWEQASAAAAVAERRERRPILLACAGVGVVALIAAALWLAGVVRPGVVMESGSAVTAHVESGVAIDIEIVNHGVLPERLASLAVDNPGITITDARFVPEVLASGESGHLRIEGTVDCAARENGQWGALLTTERPWGVVERALPDRAGGPIDLLFLGACTP